MTSSVNDWLSFYLRFDSISAGRGVEQNHDQFVLNTPLPILWIKERYHT